MERMIVKLIILLVFCFLMTGCWDSEDIQKRDIVLAIGIGQNEDEYSATLEIAKIRSSTTKDKESSTIQNITLLQKSATNMEDLVSFIYRSADFPMYFGASRVLIFSDDIAKKGIENTISLVSWLPDFRKNMDIIITGDNVNELLSDVPENDISVGFAIEDTIFNLADKGRALHVTVSDIVNRISVNKSLGCYIPYLDLEKDETTLLGYGIFKDSKLIGKISYDEAQGMQYLMGNKASIRFDIPIPLSKDNKSVFWLELSKRKINTDYINDRLIFDIKIDVSLKLRYYYKISNISDEQSKIIEQVATDTIKSQIKNIITKAQKDFKCDFFDFILYFRAQHPGIYRQIKNDWNEKFNNAEVNVSITPKMGHGILIDPNAKNPYDKK